MVSAGSGRMPGVSTGSDWHAYMDTHGAGWRITHVPAVTTAARVAPALAMSSVTLLEDTP
jgi:hypothetical protein